MRRSTRARVWSWAGYASCIAALALSSCLSRPIADVDVGGMPFYSYSYLYDELGRLTAVVDTTGEFATYRYDAEGNILSIGRGHSTGLSIIDFVPKHGPVGAPISILGTGFDANSTTLVATVPFEAGSGRISVATPRGSTMSVGDFFIPERLVLREPLIIASTAASESPGVRETERTDSPEVAAEITDSASDGDPVDLGTGLYMLRKTDLFVPDILPIDLRRVYRPRDPNLRPFGIGATHPYEMFLWSPDNWSPDNTPREINLILPDGGRVRYDRISPGHGFADAVLEHTATRTTFYGSRISWNGNGWDLARRDGIVYVFGHGAPLQAIRDRHGNTLTITRANGQKGRVTRITTPNGRWVKFSYDATKRITRAEDNIGRGVSYVYDDESRLVKVTDAAGGVSEYTYDTAHSMLTITEPRGIVFLTNEYDSGGRAMKQTLADGSTWRFDYTLDAAGKIVRADVTDLGGLVRRMIFNSDGDLVTDTRALGTPEEYTSRHESGSGRSQDRADPSPQGAPESVRPPISERFELDARGNPVSLATPLGERTRLAYNPAGQITSITDPMGNVTRFGYDLGDLVAVTDPSGNTTTRFFDGVGRLVSETNPLGHTMRYEYDALSRLIRVTDPSDGVTAFGYDPNGNVLTVTDAKGHATTHVYDSRDHLIARTDPLGRTERFEYNPAGNLIRYSGRDGQVRLYRYDALNRRIGATYADGTTERFAYDTRGRLVEARDSSGGSIENTYDNRDRLISQRSPLGTIHYQYDDHGRRVGMVLPGDVSISYAYDGAGRLTRVTQGNQVVDIGYDAAGRRTSLRLPNGASVEYRYDAASRVTALIYRTSRGILGDLRYEYDPAGNRTRVSGSLAWGLWPEPVGNAVYDAANRQLAFGSKVFRYDADGHVTSIADPTGLTTLGWDARGHLTGVSGPGLAALFTYDPLGRRVTKDVNGRQTRFLYDGPDIVQEIVAGTPVSYVRTLFVDEPIVRDGREFYLADALGSIIAITDPARTVTNRYRYDPMGHTVSVGAPTANPFQYTGREHDLPDLYFYRSRYYAPSTGRFLSEEPRAIDRGDVNSYPYACNNAVTFLQPVRSGERTGGTFDAGWVEKVIRGSHLPSRVSLPAWEDVRRSNDPLDYVGPRSAPVWRYAPLRRALESASAAVGARYGLLGGVRLGLSGACRAD